MLVLLLCFFGGTLHAVRGFSGWFPGSIEPFGFELFGESYDYPISGEKADSGNGSGPGAACAGPTLA